MRGSPGRGRVPWWSAHDADVLAGAGAGAGRVPPRAFQGTWAPPGPGTYTLLVRATDAGGAEQPLAPVWNRLGYGNNGVQRLRVTVR